MLYWCTNALMALPSFLCNGTKIKSYRSFAAAHLCKSIPPNSLEIYLWFLKCSSLQAPFWSACLLWESCAALLLYPLKICLWILYGLTQSTVATWTLSALGGSSLTFFPGIHVNKPKSWCDRKLLPAPLKLLACLELILIEFLSEMFKNATESHCWSRALLIWFHREHSEKWQQLLWRRQNFFCQ